jgi:hypothetical protein
MGMSEFTIVLVVIIVFVLLVVVVRPFMWSSTSEATDDPIDITRKQPGDIDLNGWQALNDERVQKHLPHNKIEAIKAYRELTGEGLKESKDAIDAYLARPEKLQPPDEAKKRDTEAALPLSDAGVRDLLKEGKFEEAVNAYKTFAGVDYFTARNAVEDIQRRMSLSDILADDNPAEIESSNRQQEKTRWE